MLGARTPGPDLASENSDRSDSPQIGSNPINPLSARRQESSVREIGVIHLRPILLPHRSLTSYVTSTGRGSFPLSR